MAVKSIKLNLHNKFMFFPLEEFYWGYYLNTFFMMKILTLIYTSSFFNMIRNVLTKWKFFNLEHFSLEDLNSFVDHRTFYFNEVELFDIGGFYL